MSCGIGALVITRDEAKNIEACLRSLDFCDERVVVDSFSSDRTVELALPLAEHVYRRSFKTHAEQKNWGMRQLATPWILILDADERVPPKLREELQELAARNEADGYWILRANYFFGRRIRGAGWNRDRVLRLLRRGAGSYPEQAVHEEIELRAGMRSAVCRHRLLHYSYEDWPSSFARLVDYSTRGAAQKAARGRRGGRWRMISAPSLRFFRQYVLQSGWRDGLHGFSLCALSAAQIFLREAKLALGETTFSSRGTAPDGALRVEVVQGRAISEVVG
jgi:glycosyltransferase involved in cell wall biosynthesis